LGGEQCREVNWVGVDVELAKIHGRDLGRFSGTCCRVTKMTGYTVHTGSSKKFISGWDRVFKKAGVAGKKQTASPASQKPANTRKKG
jgi:hypothetical protein